MIVTLGQIRAQLNFTDDIGPADDVLLTDKIKAAQAHIERMLGFLIEDRFGGEDQPPVPPDLAEAVLQLAAHWYEVREAVNIGNIVNDVPFGVREIVMGHKDWSF